MPDDTIRIFIMGKEYPVPPALTIMKALEYCGYRFIRGCGCRGGICGACGTVYRLPDSYKLHVGLACQTVVEPNMHLTQIPFYPANKARYDIEQIAPSVETILGAYPEISRCLACGTCNRACPQDLEVMNFVQAALRGDVVRAARLSFECIMCGLCASRCPAEIVQYHIAILCRRLYGRHVAPPAAHLDQQVRDVEQHACDAELDELVHASADVLKSRYNQRQIEPV